MPHNKFSCTKCCYITCDIKIYIKHCRKCNGPTQKLMCPVNGCNRFYSAEKTFKKHYYMHSVNITKPDDYSIFETNIVVDNSKSPSNILSNTPETENSNKIQEILTSFENIKLKFALKLFADKSIPRKKTIEITNEVYKFVNDILVEIRSQVSDNTKEEIFSGILKSLGDNKNCSEYMYLQKLQNKEILVPCNDYLLDSYHKIHDSFHKLSLKEVNILS